MRQSSLVGREREQEQLAAALARCRAGTGGLVLVSGEAGVGKSRLVTEVLSTWEGRRLVSTADLWQDAFTPIAEVLRTGSPRDAARGLSPRASPGPGPALVDALRELGSQGPAVVVLEDLQEADTATIELLPCLAVALEDRPLLVLGVYRRGRPARGRERSHPSRGHR